jgi:hypothetical protein
VFVGHSVLAFALAAMVSHRLGVSRRPALLAGLVAGLFAAVPDVDVAYALAGVGGALAGGSDLVAGFWGASAVTHRGVTHSLLVAVPAVAAFAGWPDRRLATPLAVGIVALAAAASGPLTGAVAALFVVAGLAVGRLSGRWFPPQTTAALAAVGLLSHPFGDLLTGDPPAMAFPLAAGLLDGRVAPFADPTLNLLLAFGAELATLWVGAWAVARVQGWSLRAHVDRRAALGVGYAGATLVLPAPTMEVAYPFVFSVLAVGTVGATGWRSWTRAPRRSALLGAAATALAAVTVAGTAYTVAYLLAG